MKLKIISILNIQNSLKYDDGSGGYMVSELGSCFEWVVFHELVLVARVWWVVSYRAGWVQWLCRKNYPSWTDGVMNHM